jgi:ParB-like chromosome segregation protein Spo0J
MEVGIRDITVRERFRKDLGDIDALVDSINRLGLLQPIGVSQMKGGYRLVYGQRRLEAFKRMDRKAIPARLIDVDHMLSAEHDENMVRKEFTPSEAVEIAEAIREKVEAEAKKRVGGRPKKDAETSGNLPEVSKGETRTILSKRVGMSERTYDKARKVVEAAREEPEVYGDLVERMDRSRSVDGAFRELVKRCGGETEAAQTEKSKASVSASDHTPLVQELLDLWAKATPRERRSIRRHINGPEGGQGDLLADMFGLWSELSAEDRRRFMEEVMEDA